MKFREYQKKADLFAAYPTSCYIKHLPSANDYVREECIPYLYPALALSEETGEVLGKIAKYVRKKDFSYDTYSALKEQVKLELGDVLWQMAALATEFELDLDDIAEANLTKLEDRKARDVIVGNGDDR